METDNITIRKPLQRHNSQINLSILNSTLLDTSNMSLPETSLDETFICLNDKIKDLTMQLQSAHLEIENVCYENMQLKAEVEKSNKIIQLYKKLGFDSTNYCIQNVGRKKNRKCLSTNNTPLKINRKVDEHLNKYANQFEPVHYEKSNQEEKLILDTVVTENTNKSQNVENSSYKAEENNEIQKIAGTLQKQIQNIHEVTKNKTKYGNLEPRKRIVILADQVGRGTQGYLQNLAGHMYEVTAFIKQGAKLSEVLRSESPLLKTLNKNDVIIVIGGTNETDPYEFQLAINRFFYNNTHTNILIGEIPYNRGLNEAKLNYDLRFMCGKFENVSFVDMDYSRRKSIRNIGYFATGV